MIVGLNGRGNVPGNCEDPSGSLQHAPTLTSPGDIVYLDPIVVTDVQGCEGCPVVVATAPG